MARDVVRGPVRGTVDTDAEAPRGRAGSGPPATPAAKAGAVVDGGALAASATVAWDSVDVDMMRLAVAEARAAAAEGEVPVGAVVAAGARVLARAHNLRESRGDPTAHAEVLAVRAAAAAIGSWRLEGTTVYATMEPCPMCAGALWLARVDRLVYAVADEKAGAAGTLYNVVADPRLNHRLQVDRGLMAEESRALLRGFFAKLRDRAGASGPGPVSPDPPPPNRGASAAHAEGCPSG